MCWTTILRILSGFVPVATSLKIPRPREVFLLLTTSSVTTQDYHSSSVTTKKRNSKCLLIPLLASAIALITLSCQSGSETATKRRFSIISQEESRTQSLHSSTYSVAASTTVNSIHATSSSSSMTLSQNKELSHEGTNLPSRSRTAQSHVPVSESAQPKKELSSS